MNEIPPSPNLASLKGILARSKALMDKEDSEKPKVVKKSNKRDIHESDYHSTPIYDENDERDDRMDFSSYSPSVNNQDQNQPNARYYTEEQVLNSKLPQNIKEAMLKMPIPQLQRPPSKITLDDLEDLVDKPKKRQINENVISGNGDYITLSKSELQNMINEAVSNFFKSSYNKVLTDEAIAKTINLLIKEGKIVTKKK